MATQIQVILYSVTITADSAKIYVTALSDAIVEEDETIEITLQSETVFGLFGDGLDNNIFVDSGTVTVTLSDSGDYTAGVAIVDEFGEQVTLDNPIIINEAGEAIYYAKLTSQPIGDVSVNFNNGQTNLATIAFTQDNWDSYQKIIISEIDTTLGIDVSVTSNDSNYGSINSNIVVTNESDRNRLRVKEGGGEQAEEVPIVSIVAIEDAIEGESEPGEYLLQLNKPAPEGGLTVQYSVTSENATLDTDFEILPDGLVEIAEGELTANITVPVTDDNVDTAIPIVENNLIAGFEDLQRNVTVTLDESPDYTINENNSNDKINLIDNDEAGLEIVRFANIGAIDISDEDALILDLVIKPETFSVKETGAYATIELNLNSAPTAETTVTLTDVNNPEITQTFTFTPENWETVQEWNIRQETINDDGEAIGQLTSAIDGTLALTAVIDGNQTIALPFLQQAIVVDSLVISEGGGKEVFGVRLESEPSSNVTIEVDYDPNKLNRQIGNGLTNDLVFDSSNWDSYQKVVIEAVDNELDTNEDEGYITSEINFRPDSDDLVYDRLATEEPQLEVTINDNDNIVEENPDEVVNDSEVVASLTVINNQIDEESGTAELQVNLSQPAPAGGIVVKYQLNEETAIAGIDFVNKYQKSSVQENPLYTLTKDLTFTSPSFVDIDNDRDLDLFVGHYDDDQIIDSSPTLVDVDNDGDLDLFIGERAGVTNYDENIGFDDNGQLTFTKQKGPDIPLDGVEVPSGFSKPFFTDFDGDGDNDAFIGQNQGGVIFYENTGIGEVFIAEGESSATIELTAIPDVIAEEEETFEVRLVENLNNTGDYSYKLSETNAFVSTVKIIDNDVASVKITTDADGLNEIGIDETFSTQEDDPNSQQTFYAVLTSEPTAPVQVYLGSSDLSQGQMLGNDGELENFSRLVFTPSNWDTVLASVKLMVFILIQKRQPLQWVQI